VSKRRKWFWILAIASPVVLLIALCSVPVVAYGVCLADLESCTTSTVDRDAVAQIAELHFPDGTHLRSATYTQLLEWQLFAVVDFPAAAERQFLTGNDLPTPWPDLRAVPTGEYTSDGNWHPERVGHYAGIQRACTTTTCRDIMLGYDEPGVVVAYIYVLSDDQPHPTNS
jgi:hypothetical protein